MTNTEPEVRRFRIRGRPDADPNTMLQAADEKARSEVADDEDVFDLRVDDVTSLRVTDLWYFSYQVLKPGDTESKTALVGLGQHRHKSLIHCVQPSTSRAASSSCSAYRGHAYW